jgi:hypothetical protein
MSRFKPTRPIAYTSETLGLHPSHTLKLPFLRDRRRGSPTVTKRMRYMPHLDCLEIREVLSTLTVTSLADSGAGSLRATIAAAADGDTIKFSPSLSGSTISVISGEIAFDESLDIEGPGSKQLSVSGENISRIFDIGPDAKAVTIAGLTLEYGLATLKGGAIADSAKTGETLRLSNCTFFANQVTGNEAAGGAVWMNAGALNIANCMFNSNSAAAATDSDAAGGAVFSEGPLTISSSTFKLNNAFGGDGSGGVSPMPAGNASGGAVAYVSVNPRTSDSVSITGSFFDTNHVAGGKGADDGLNPSIGGIASGGAVSVSAGSSYAMTVAIDGDDFLNNEANGGAAGQAPAASTAVPSLAYGGTGRGGALWVDAKMSSSLQFTADSDTFLKNTAQGGIGEPNLNSAAPGSLFRGGGNGNGGGLALEAGSANTPSFNITNTAFESCKSIGGAGHDATSPGWSGGDGSYAAGGAVWVDARLASSPKYFFEFDDFDICDALGGKGGDVPGLVGKGGNGGKAEGGAVYFNAAYSDKASLGMALDHYEGDRAIAGNGGHGGTAVAALNADGANAGGGGGAAVGGGLRVDLYSSTSPSVLVWGEKVYTCYAWAGDGGTGGNNSGPAGDYGIGGNGGSAYGAGIDVAASDASNTSFIAAQCTVKSSHTYGGKGGTGGMPDANDAVGGFGADGGWGGYAYGGGIYLWGEFLKTPTDVWTLNSNSVSNCSASGGAGGAGGDGMIGGNGGKGGSAYGGGADDAFTGKLQIFHGSISKNAAISAPGGPGGSGMNGGKGLSGSPGAKSAGGGLAVDIAIGKVAMTSDVVVSKNKADNAPDVFDPDKLIQII